MKLALDQRLAQGEEIRLGKAADNQEIHLPKDIGVVQILTRANMQLPGGAMVPDTELPMGTIVYRNGVWAWTSPVGRQELSTGISFQVGRDTLRSDNPAISRNHYSLTVTGQDALVIRDENSTNGTWVVKLGR